MADERTVRGFFKALVTEQAISCTVAATVGSIVAGPIGAVATPVLSQAVEYYGPVVASRLWSWIKGRPAVEACETLAAVANLDAQRARLVIDEAIADIAPEASAATSLARTYLAAIPATLRQTLPRTPSGKSACPGNLLPRDEHDVFRLLPTFLPPYDAPCPLPGTPYVLVELVGTGGFGAVYKALSNFETEPRALKFCLDPERVFVLKREKERLDRLVQQEGSSNWPENVVRLLGHNLDHETPFLVFEYVPDGDLSVYFNNAQLKKGGPLTADEVLLLIHKLALAVCPVHEAGLTHRDLKPSNILFSGDVTKIGDFGLGATIPRSDRSVSRRRSLSDTAQELRGAGSYIYMSPEQKRGADAHSAQDVYSLGVIWYQLLVGDFGAEIGPFWDRPLAERNVPVSHVQLLLQCLDNKPENRPRDARSLSKAIDRTIRRVDEEEKRARAELQQQQLAQQEAMQRSMSIAKAEAHRKAVRALEILAMLSASACLGALLTGGVAAVVGGIGLRPIANGTIVLLFIGALIALGVAVDREKAKGGFILGEVNGCSIGFFGLFVLMLLAGGLRAMADLVPQFGGETGSAFSFGVVGAICGGIIGLIVGGIMLARD